MDFLGRIVKAQAELVKEKETMLNEIQEALQKIKRELRVQKGSHLGEVSFLITRISLGKK